MQLNLENLNAEQIRAVKHTQGPLLVLAGAGTGKTRVLTTRIGYILSQDFAKPWEILALTFTNKAANEMKSRIDAMGQGAFYAHDIWCGTFHSMCLRILKANHAAANLRPDFLIYDEDDQKSVIKQVLNNLGLSQQTKKPADYVEEFSRKKDDGLLNADSTDKVFNAYNTELARLGVVDFGDIILYTLRLFQENPEILEHYRQKFKYILVDEFQDTNAAQMQLLNFLTRDKESPNICCVGDDDQSIYSWRGAEIKNILDFEKTFPGAEIIRLETNYRSTGNILGAANSLIKHNAGRLGKDLKTNKANYDGEKVYVETYNTDRDEVKHIVDKIKIEGTPYNNKSILIRSGGGAKPGTISRLFEEEFIWQQIPYRMIGQKKFYDRMEIRDTVAYIRLLVHPFDDMSFLRIIGKPSRHIGPVAIEKIRACGSNLMAGLRACELKGKQKEEADKFLSVFDFDWENMTPRDAAQKLLDDSGYIKMWQESKDPDAQERINHIRELINDVVAKYDCLNDFLEQEALTMTDENDNPYGLVRDAVTIMTIHAAKGNEFDTVFLPAWEQGFLPNQKSKEDRSIEEERRLAYVALTRAKRRAFITNAKKRTIYDENGPHQIQCSPSTFIDEMDSKYLHFVDNTNPYSYFGNDRPTPKPYQPQNHYVKKTFVKPRETLVGRQAKHVEYGTGVIIEEGTGILTIAFGSRGIKKIAKDFVEIL